MAGSAGQPRFERAVADPGPRSAVEVLRTAPIAYVCMDAGGFLVEINRAGEELTGWSRDEAVGRAVGDLMIPARHRSAHVAGLERFLSTGSGPVIGAALVVDALHRDGHELPVELTITVTGDERGPCFHGFLRDVGARVRDERFRATQHALVAAMVEADTVDAAVPGLLRAIGEGMGWDAGLFWRPGTTCPAVWCSERLDGAAWADVCGGHGPALGDEPLLRRSTPTIAMIGDDAPPRWAAAARSGARTAAILPLLDDGEPRGAIELLACRPRRREPELLDML
ncbi:MAG: PAS domain S-box protein, partial [Vicinamibacteria bacterium]